MDVPPSSYACMPRHRVARGAFSVRAVSPEDIEPIRLWRNAQMDVLRQTQPISPDEQVAYYAQQIWPTLALPQPPNILLAYEESGRRIGYGGLVHIAWPHRRAEVSFLLDPTQLSSRARFDRLFETFLLLMQELAFEDLNLRRLCTETYAFRTEHIDMLEKCGFEREGVLRGHVIVNGVPTDSVLQGCVVATQEGNSLAATVVAGAKPIAPECMRPWNVLITSAAGKAPLVRAMQQAVRKLGADSCVVAGDISSDVATRYVADAFWTMPRCTASEADAIIAGCLERKIGAVLPTRDGELTFWAEHASTFADAGVDVIVSPPASVALCLDKLKFAAFGKREGLPFIAASERPDDLPAKRFVVKERFGAGSLSIGLDLDRAAAIDHAVTLQHPIFQPLIEGVEISADAWADRNHRVKGVVLRRREKVVNGESQTTTTFNNAKIEAEMVRVIEALGLRGPVVLQAIIDDAGAIHVIECNSRFGGASTLSLAAGLDSLYWSLLEARGADVAQVAFAKLDRPLRQVRVPSDIYVHDPDI